MSGEQLLGAALVCLPFLAIAVFIIWESGWGAFAFVFGTSAAIIAVIAAGVHLLNGGPS